jgi:FkbM family methyltransferase
VARQVERAGKKFQIVDNHYNNWDFWAAFEAGSWEPVEVAKIGEMLPGQLLFDIGAWIGPFSLWAASNGVRVIAVEPDPVALAELQENSQANGLSDLITIVPIAIALKDEPVTLNTQNGGGDSTSSMTRTNMPDSIQVAGNTLEWLIATYGVPDLIKMDIEGGEGLIVPANGPRLRELHIPLLLSIHWGWFSDEARILLDAELANWQTQYIEKDTYLYTP